MSDVDVAIVRNEAHYLARLPEPGVMEGLSSPGSIVAISLGLFFLIYD